MGQSTVEWPERTVIDLTEREPIQILHVDDETDFLKAAKQILEEQGRIQVDTASSVEEAMERMEKKMYDAIVCDYIMPRKDGLQFLKELRGSGNNIPFIIFTGKGREDVAIEALNLGADRYFSKVGSPETVYGELAHGIRQAVKTKQAHGVLRAQYESFPLPAYTWQKMGEDFVLVDYNTAAVEITHGNIADYVGRKAGEMYRDRPEILEELWRCFTEKTTIKREMAYEYMSTCETKYLSVTYAFVPSNLVIVYTEDITERKRMDKAIRESQEKFERLFMGNPEAAVYMDKDFRILDVNPKFEYLFGYSVDEVRGRHINELVVPEDKMEEAETLDRKAKKGYVSRNTVRKRKDGTLIPVSVSAAPIIVEARSLGGVAMYRDISELKETQRELEESRRHFQRLFNLMVDPVAIVDKKGKILDVTDRVEEIAGFKREELVGKNFMRTKIATAKSKAVMLKNLTKRMMGLHLDPYEVEIVTKDGRRLPYEINAAKIEYKSQPADMVVFRDITERKKVKEKLRVVGRLTRHDVLNKLSVVTSNAYLAKRKLSDDSEALRCLEEIESAVEQAVRIFEFARTYEQLGMEELEYVEVEKIVERAVLQFPDLKGAEVINKCGGLMVLADSSLSRLFYNLIHNSLEHGEEVSQIRMYYEEAGKDRLKLVYEDDGVGVPAGEKELIFRQGYGLYLIGKMCEVYGWTIRETGKQGKGAQFTITIPKMNEKRKTSYRLSQNR